MATPSEETIVYQNYYCSLQEGVPKIMFQDVVCGSVEPRGEFEALAWRSQLPTYYNCDYYCEIIHLGTTAAKRKRSTRNGIALP
uniref:Uncharacterized protein n=1 Tax=Arundo donax TaxID=35708 RepID=A0A0A9ALB4_ARUDO